jgi:hypothetical protein
MELVTTARLASLVMAPLAIDRSHHDIGVLLFHLDLGVVASCCSTQLDAAFSERRTSLRGRAARFDRRARRVLLSAWLGWAASLQAAVRDVAVAAAASLAALPFALGATVLEVAPHAFELPQHSCPFCLLPPGRDRYRLSAVRSHLSRGGLERGGCLGTSSRAASAMAERGRFVHSRPVAARGLRMARGARDRCRARGPLRARRRRKAALPVTVLVALLAPRGAALLILTACRARGPRCGYCGMKIDPASPWRCVVELADGLRIEYDSPLAARSSTGARRSSSRAFFWCRTIMIALGGGGDEVAVRRLQRRDRSNGGRPRSGRPRSRAAIRTRTHGHTSARPRRRHTRTAKRAPLMSEEELDSRGTPAETSPGHRTHLSGRRGHGRADLALGGSNRRRPESHRDELPPEVFGRAQSA